MENKHAIHCDKCKIIVTDGYPSLISNKYNVCDQCFKDWFKAYDEKFYKLTEEFFNN